MSEREIALYASDPDDFPKLVDFLKDRTADMIFESKIDDATILRRYGVYANGSFTDMMGWAGHWARHPDTRHTILENLVCEKMQDHPGMMLGLLLQAGVLPDEEAMRHMGPVMQELRDLQRDPLTVGLVGTMHFAMVENTSLHFIPDIGERAKRLGAKDFNYVEIHGVADIEHANAFIDATMAEASMGYDYPPLAAQAAWLAIGIIKSIYH